MPSGQGSGTNTGVLREKRLPSEVPKKRGYMLREERKTLGKAPSAGERMTLGKAPSLPKASELMRNERGTNTLVSTPRAGEEMELGNRQSGRKE